MARIFQTGFETGAVLNGLPYVVGFNWASAPTISTTQKRTGAYSAYFGGNAAGRVTLPSPKDELYIRLGVYPTEYKTGYNGRDSKLLYFADSIPALHVLFGVQPSTGLLRLSYYNNGDNILATSAAALPLNVFSCLEFYVKIADAPNGEVTVKLNGAIILTYSGDTKYATDSSVTYVWFGCYYPSNYNEGTVVGYYDDIAINDTTGSVNNSWIGRGGIRPLLVNADGTNTGLTPSTGGDNYALVDEVPASDTDYVSGSTPDDYDLYTVDTSGMPASYTVSAVKWIARAKVTEDAANITPVIRSESTTEQQSDIALSTSFTVKELIMETDPIDDAAWTKTKIDALEIGAAVG